MFFFIIYVNDFPGLVSDGNKIVLYADDSKLYKVNASKCKVMRITKRRSPFTYHYHIDGTKLDSVSLHRDLGLFLEQKLIFQTGSLNLTGINKRFSFH